MTREVYIEKFLRQVYGGFPNDDADISANLVNQWLNEAICIVAKQNYKDNISLDGIGYVNNSFYVRFTGLQVTPDEQNTWKVTLPEIPVGLGANEGVSKLQFKMDGEEKRVSFPCVPLTQAQTTYFQTMRPIPRKVLYFYEGKTLYAMSTINLSQYTATITMVSGGDSTNLQSEINVPLDYFPVIDEYLFNQLNRERNQPVDDQNEGLDAIRTT